MKTLYTNGCSWTYGEELKKPNKTSWPVVLSDKLGYVSINDGQNAGSNSRIVRTTIDFVNNWCKSNNPSDLFVCVMWTSKYRLEIPVYNPEGNLAYEQIQFTYTNDSRPYWKKLKKLFLKHHFFEEDIECRYLNNVFHLYLFLKHKNIPFLFTKSFEESFESGIQKHNTIDTNVILSKSFLTLVEENEFAFGPLNHPLERAHSVWANYVYDYIIEKELI